MGEPRIFKPSELRRAVSDWAAQGFSVEVRPDGTIRVEPPKRGPEPDEFDLVDMRR